MGKEDLSKAELYRKERKERLAKEAKKNAKRNAKVAKVKATALKVVAIICAVAVVFGIAVGIFNATGSEVFRSKVATVGNHSISSVEFGYYYRTVYNMYLQYAQYGYDMGLDASKSPDEQKYTMDDEQTTAPAQSGETTVATEATTATNYDTWDDFFSASTIDQLKGYYILCDKAAEENIKLTDAEIKAVDDQLEELRSTASENNFTLNAYLKQVYGSGINEKLVRKFMVRDALAQKYQTEKQKQFANGYASDKVFNEYNANRQTYDYVDYRTQTFTVSENQDAAKTKKLAEEFLAKVSSSSTFEKAADEILIKDAIKNAQSDDKEKVNEASIRKEYEDNKDNTLQKKQSYSSVKSVNEDLAKWLFDSARKAGQTKLVEVKTDDTASSYIVAYLERTAYKDEEKGVNVRHILFKFEKDDGAQEATQEQKDAAKVKAQACLDEWKKGAKTEESFAALATEKSEDTGSASNGGLYENVAQGQMVETFNDWIFDSSRKTGDTDIVETTYGYHVMYFVSKSDMPIWEKTVRDAMAQKDYTDFAKELNDSAEYTVEKHSVALKSASKKVIKSIKQYIFNASQSQQAQQ